VPPPENDQEAKQLSEKIKQWINEGRPKPEDTPKETPEDSEKEPSGEDEEQKPDKEEEKPKKKRGRFGFFRK
jgi:fused signal recognition particle receptor